MSTYSWETGATTYNVQAMDSGTRFRCAISQATEAARRRFPHSNDRIERAYELVHAAKVVLHPATKTATVTSSDGDKAYTVNGVCSCPDASTKAPEGWCKHRISVAILRQALEIMKAFGTAQGPVTIQAEKLVTEEEEPAVGTQPLETEADATEEEETASVTEAVAALEAQTAAVMAEVAAHAPVVEAEVVPAVPRIPREFLYDNHGTPAILWGGLLHMAHQAGMHSMVVDVVTVSETFAVMRATAKFNDGGIWSDVGDSTPENVGKKVAASFIRMASTRAMARVVRTALDVHYLAACELPDSDDIAD